MGVGADKDERYGDNEFSLNYAPDFNYEIYGFTNETVPASVFSSKSIQINGLRTRIRLAHSLRKTAHYRSPLK
jgi:hypothetical protein